MRLKRKFEHDNWIAGERFLILVISVNVIPTAGAEGVTIESFSLPVIYSLHLQMTAALLVAVVDAIKTGTCD